ncbi:MAG: HAMP domain-containing histidine kinase [Coriobacteriia bacterium]|nr:HAMP domain-containing histidine kinase [Coriobacteriia bacterium]
MVFVVVTVVWFEIFMYHEAAQDYVSSGRESLERVAFGRAEDCGHWVSYHAQDPLEMSDQVGIAQRVGGIDSPDDPTASAFLLDRLDSIVALRGYDSVSLHRQDGSVLLSSGAAPAPLSQEVLSGVATESLYFSDGFDKTTGRWYAQWVTRLDAGGKVESAALVAFRADMESISQAVAGPVSTPFDVCELAVVRPGTDEAGYSFLNHADAHETVSASDPVVIAALLADVDGTGSVSALLADGSTVYLGVSEVVGTNWRVVVAASEDEMLGDMDKVPRMLVSLTLAIGLVAGLIVALIRGNMRQRHREYQTLQDLRYAVEAQDRFLANMSHELRTPLNSVMGFTSVLASGMAGEINDEQRRQLEMIDQSSKRLLALVNDVLDLSKLKADADVVDVSEFYALELGSTVCELMKPLSAGKSLECALSVSDEDLLLSSDRTMIERILLNLLSNSIKFTQKGFVRLDVRSLGDERVEFAVVDSGCGIPADRLGEVMQEFRQIIEPQGGKPVGTGLGLAISKAMAESLGGELTVESTYGVGSTFRLIVPRAYTA